MSGIAIQNGGVVVDGDGGLCLDCCDPAGGYSDFDVGCFIEGDGAGCGSNPDWDEWPPFGGPGKTPATYTLAIEGYITCPVPKNSPAPDINGVWDLAIYSCSWPSGEACWALSTSIGGIDVGFSLTLCNSFTMVPKFVVSAPGETLFLRDILGDCKIVVDSVANFFTGCGNPGDRSGYGGTVSWRPGTIGAWDECTDYEVGDMVAHEGVFYICIQAHAAGTPPTCAGSKEPPNASYWDVA